MRRLLRTLFGFFAAMLAFAVSQVLFVLPLSELVAMEQAARGERVIEMGVLVLRAATHSAIFSAGFALIAILVAVWQHLRDWTYYATIGMIVSLGGFLAQYASENATQPTILNNYALIAFMTSGAVGGLVYWMFAGRHAGRRRPPARLRVADTEAAGQAAPTTAGRRAGVSDDRAASARLSAAAQERREALRQERAAHQSPGPTVPKAPTARPADTVREVAVSTTSAAPEGGGRDMADAKAATGTDALRTATAKNPPAPAGQEPAAGSAPPMTSVPSTGPKLQVKPRLRVAGSVPESGQAKPAKT